MFVFSTIVWTGCTLLHVEPAFLAPSCQAFLLLQWGDHLLIRFSWWSLQYLLKIIFPAYTAVSSHTKTSVVLSKEIFRNTYLWEMHLTSCHFLPFTGNVFLNFWKCCLNLKLSLYHCGHAIVQKTESFRDVKKRAQSRAIVEGPKPKPEYTTKILWASCGIIKLSRRDLHYMNFSEGRKDFSLLCDSDSALQTQQNSLYWAAYLKKNFETQEVKLLTAYVCASPIF